MMDVILVISLIMHVISLPGPARENPYEVYVLILKRESGDSHLEEIFSDFQTWIRPDVDYHGSEFFQISAKSLALGSKFLQKMNFEKFDVIAFDLDDEYGRDESISSELQEKLRNYQRIGGSLLWTHATIDFGPPFINDELLHNAGMHKSSDNLEGSTKNIIANRVHLQQFHIVMECLFNLPSRYSNILTHQGAEVEVSEFHSGSESISAYPENIVLASEIEGSERFYLAVSEVEGKRTIATQIGHSAELTPFEKQLMANSIYWLSEKTMAGRAKGLEKYTKYPHHGRGDRQPIFWVFISLLILAGVAVLCCCGGAVIIIVSLLGAVFALVLYNTMKQRREEREGSGDVGGEMRKMRAMVMKKKKDVAKGVKYIPIPTGEDEDEDEPNNSNPEEIEIEDRK